MEDEAYARYVAINLPHARTIASRISHTLEAMGALQDERDKLFKPMEELEQELQDYEDDPPRAEALLAADSAANRARTLASAIIETPLRGDRLGRHLRNLFECLGLAEEGATLSLQCGEDPESLLR